MSALDFIRTFVAGSTVLLVLALVSPVSAEEASDEQIFNEFRQIVSSFDKDEQVASWEAFILKYPNSPYVPQVRGIIDDLKAGRTPSKSSLRAPKRSSSRSSGSSGSANSRFNDQNEFKDEEPDVGDLDLDFVEGSADRAKPRADDDASFFDDDAGGSGFDDSDFGGPPKKKRASAGTDDWSSGFEDDGGDDPGEKFFRDDGETKKAAGPKTTATNKRAAKVDKPAEGELSVARNRNRRRRVGTHEWRKTNSTWARRFVFEVAPFAAASPDEVYVRNTILGVNAGVHVGRRLFAEAELAGVIARQTPLLLQLKEIDGQPEVLMGYRFMAGAGGGVKIFTGGNRFEQGGHDLFARGSAGLMFSDVEVCRENTDGIKCAQPQLVSGWFPYGTVGLGYRYYFTQYIGLRADVRYRGLLELIDGVSAIRGNFQLSLGGSFSF